MYTEELGQGQIVTYSKYSKLTIGKIAAGWTGST